MALKEITDHILRDAEAKAAEIERDAEEKSRVILEEAKKKAEEERKRLLSEAQKRAEEERKRIIAMAKLEARNKVLAAKQNKVETVFNLVLKSLVDLPESEYLEIFKSMLKRAVKGGEEVIVNERDRKRITSQFLAEINPSLKLSSETREISGGFVLKSGRIETNSSFEALVSAARSEVEPEVLRVLLGSS